MSLAQRILKAILPKQMADNMEAESRKWLMVCPDGHKISVWEAGAIRWGAGGKPKRLYHCRDCGRARWMTYEKATPAT